MKRALLIVLLLAACGKQGELMPRPGQRSPATPRGASIAPTPSAMLVRQPQAAPVRVDDPLKRSQERPDDRFDQPPKH